MKCKFLKFVCAVMLMSMASLPARADNTATVTDFLQKIAQGCDVNMTSFYIAGCKNNETGNFDNWIRQNKPTDLFPILAKLGASTDPKMAFIAVNAIGTSWSMAGDDWRKPNSTPEVADFLLNFVKNTDNSVANRTAAVMAKIAMIAGKNEELYKVVDEHKSDYVRTNAYPEYMTYGRTAVLPVLKAIASKGNSAWTVAALKAPQYMYEQTDAEKAEYCPWAVEYLSNADLNIASQAARDMVYCKGSYIDKLLEDGQKKLTAGTFKAPYSEVFREPCFSPMSGVIDKAAFEAQCDKVYAFLLTVADNETVEESVRGSALWNIYYQRRDQKTLDLMRKYEKHKNPVIAKKAQEAITSLTTTYKLK